MKQLLLPVLVGGAAIAACGVALAQSPDYMIQDCSYSSQVFYQDFEAKAEAKYEGQRTDGTHAVNGTIYLENRSAYFSCSYNAAGDTLVEFFAEQQSWPGFARGEGSPYQAKTQGGAQAQNGPKEWDRGCEDAKVGSYDRSSHSDAYEEGWQACKQQQGSTNADWDRGCEDSKVGSYDRTNKSADYEAGWQACKQQ
jgi:hypothetical protein